LNEPLIGALLKETVDPEFNLQSRFQHDIAIYVPAERQAAHRKGKRANDERD
jgi:hypothetical protein